MQPKNVFVCDRCHQAQDTDSGFTCIILPTKGYKMGFDGELVDIKSVNMEKWLCCNCTESFNRWWNQIADE